jgi:hypothetical protein
MELDTTADQVAEAFGQMIAIESKVIYDWLTRMRDCDKLLIETLGERLQRNGAVMANLALVVRNTRIDAEAEIARVNELLKETGDGD